MGTSSGRAIPRQGCRCPQCLSRDPRDRRLRSSILIDGKFLVDCGPDIKNQFSIFPDVSIGIPTFRRDNFQFSKIKGIIITHRHHDHIAGLDEIEVKQDRVHYLKGGEKLKINGLKIEAFRVPHSKIIPTVGLIIAKKVIYLPDCSQLPRKVRKNLAPAKLLILDGSVLERDFGGHQAIKKQLRILKRFKVLGKESQVYFTHNGHTRIPHRELEHQIQSLGGPQFHLAYDGLKLEI